MTLTLESVEMIPHCINVITLICILLYNLICILLQCNLSDIIYSYNLTCLALFKVRVSYRFVVLLRDASVELLSNASLFLACCNRKHQASLNICNSESLLEQRLHTKLFYKTWTQCTRHVTNKTNTAVFPGLKCFLFKQEVEAGHIKGLVFCLFFSISQ